ncbi:ABC transporter permease [bacterium]|nr:ABC transporter permease [bacterium]
MELYKQVLRQTVTYRLFTSILANVNDFSETLGNITICGIKTIKAIFKGEMSSKELIEQCERFGISSLPITLSIVGMTTVIIVSQIAQEMVKQGGGNMVGALVSILMVRELGVIMSGFAIISMIGSSLASEIATMRVTEQIDALRTLKVNPFGYLFAPRVLAGMIMMPPVVIISSFIGVLMGALTSNLVSGLSYRAFFDSLWLGIFAKDLFICIAKAFCFGGAIALISCSFGYHAKGGAKGVGIATTGAVVWSFVAIVIIDMIFAIGFFF